MENTTQVERQQDGRPLEDRVVDDKFIRDRYLISATTSWRLRNREHNPLPHFFAGAQVRYWLSDVERFFRSSAEVKA